MRATWTHDPANKSYCLFYDCVYSPMILVTTRIGVSLQESWPACLNNYRLEGVMPLKQGEILCVARSFLETRAFYAGMAERSKATVC